MIQPLKTYNELKACSCKGYDVCVFADTAQMENMKKQTIPCPGVTFPIHRFLLPPPVTASQPLAHGFTMRSQLKFLC